MVITGRRQEKLNKHASPFKWRNLYRYFVADVADRSQVAALIDWINREFGPLDIVVNNAGVNIRERRMEELKPEAWAYVFDVNTNGVFNVIHAVLPQMPPPARRPADHHFVARRRPAQHLGRRSL